MEIEIEIFETASSALPFNEWFEGLREMHTRAKVLTRLDRLRLGNFGDCKSLDPDCHLVWCLKEWLKTLS